MSRNDYLAFCIESLKCKSGEGVVRGVLEELGLLTFNVELQLLQVMQPYLQQSSVLHTK